MLPSVTGYFHLHLSAPLLMAEKHCLYPLLYLLNSKNTYGQMFLNASLNVCSVVNKYLHMVFISILDLLMLLSKRNICTDLKST